MHHGPLAVRHTQPGSLHPVGPLAPAGPTPSHNSSVHCPGLVCKPVSSSSSVFSGEYMHTRRHEFVKGTEVWVTVIWALDEQEWQEDLA